MVTPVLHEIFQEFLGRGKALYLVEHHERVALFEAGRTQGLQTLEEAVEVRSVQPEGIPYVVGRVGEVYHQTHRVLPLGEALYQRGLSDAPRPLNQQRCLPSARTLPVEESLVSLPLVHPLSLNHV